MLQNMATHTSAKASAITAQERRMAQLRRAYQRVLRRKPTMIERAAMERAARLTARAEVAALDPDATLDDVVRIDNAAARARARLADLIGGLGRRKKEPAGLGALLGIDHG
jgi:hypothetical protein